jgi:RND family efflux transporter MFP subunit
MLVQWLNTEGTSQLKSERLRRLISQGSKILTVGILLGGCVGIIAWLSGMFVQKIPPGRTDQEYVTEGELVTDTVHEVDRPVIEEAIGTLRAANRTNVSSRIMATIAEILVVAGQEVKQGDILITLNAEEYQRRFEQVTQSQKAAESAERLAQADFLRVQTLREQNVVSQSEFDTVANRLTVAQAEHLRATEMVAEAEVMLSYQTIRAARDGMIIDRFAEPGDLAQPGTPLLSMYDSKSLRLETPVMESTVQRLKVGDKLIARIDAVERETEAIVREIVPQADAASRSFLIKTSLASQEGLYEGMFGRLLIPGGVQRHLCIHTDAVVRIGQLEFVDVMLASGETERRLVRTGSLGMPQRQEVLSGVRAGDRVILHPAREVSE